MFARRRGARVAPKTGMGVEFARNAGQDQRGRVEELMPLTANREVPKIFVGRKETAEKTWQATSSIASTGPQTNEVADPLLELVRSGAPLTAEQFLSDLRAQRLGDRRDPRIDLALPVSLSGTDVSGRPLDQRVMTINISRRGALLEGVHGMLKMGRDFSFAACTKKKQFRVAWVERGFSSEWTDRRVSCGSEHYLLERGIGGTAESGLEDKHPWRWRRRR